MSTRVIPEPVRRRQAEASDPQVSAFVSANAGAGKTHVLAQRVIRLLLAGTDPMKILCITFTKAAAANMAALVFDTLAHWIALDDDALDREMRAIGETAIGPAQRSRARRLFASALDTRRARYGSWPRAGCASASSPTPDARPGWSCARCSSASACSTTSIPSREPRRRSSTG